MNEHELMALPEWPTGFGFIETTDRTGAKIRIPVAPKLAAFYHAPDDPMLIVDTAGIEWSVGSVGGIKYRIKRLWSHR